MELAAIAQRSAVDQVVERITDVIRSRKLDSGARLPGELEFIQQLNVSRSVLREALARLQALGLVEIRRGHGTFVGDVRSMASCVRLLRSAVTITPRDLLQYAELRVGIEPQAARLAAQRITPPQVAELRGLLDQLDHDLPDAERVEIDFRFHRKLIEIGGNPLMRSLMEVIYEFVLTQMVRTICDDDHALTRLDHRRIFDAVRDGDPDRAEEAMRLHMRAIIQRLTLWQESGA